MSAISARIIFVSGLSGSGRSTAMAALEDLSFYCVDNLPVQLVDQFLNLCAKATPPIDKVALAIDAREVPFLREVPAVVEKLRRSGAGGWRQRIGRYLGWQTETADVPSGEAAPESPTTPTGLADALEPEEAT